MPTAQLTFASAEDLQAFLAWKSRVTEEGITGPGLAEAFLALQKAEVILPVPTTFQLTFASEEDAQAFLTWQTRTREEGTDLADHLTGDYLTPAVVALDRAEVTLLNPR